MLAYHHSAFKQLECPECGRDFLPESLQACCPDCSGPLFAMYDWPAARSTLTSEALSQRAGGIWRWSEILPVRTPAFRLTLGEPYAPVLQAAHLGEAFGLSAFHIKDESRAALGTLESRGMVVAVAHALEMGRREFVMAAYGSDGVALAACSARSRTSAHIYMPEDAPLPDRVAIKTFGAELHLVNGSISEAARLAAEAAALHGWWDLSAFHEPYRCEGAKTIGLELAEAFNWVLPDVLIIPGSDGLEFLGIWKALNELELLGLIGAHRPRMVAVRFGGRAETGPALFVERLLLRAIQASKGTVLAVSDEQALSCQKELATQEGIFAGPQAGAGLAAVKHLAANGWLDKDQSVVLVNGGSGLNYL